MGWDGFSRNPVSVVKDAPRQWSKEQVVSGQMTTSRSRDLTATVNLIKSMKYRLFVSRYGDQSGDIAALVIWTAEIAASIHPFEQEASVVPAT
jgi:hypothetical protein